MTNLGMCNRRGAEDGWRGRADKSLMAGSFGRAVSLGGHIDDVLPSRPAALFGFDLAECVDFICN